MEIARQVAVTEDWVAATLAQLAASQAGNLPDLLTLGEAAASQAIRMRHWADDHAASG